MKQCAIMSSRLQHAGLVVMLVATLVIVAFAMRTPTPPPTTDLPRSAASADPSRSPSGSAKPSQKPSNSASDAAVPKGATAVILGDSFAAGAGATSPEQRWSTLLTVGTQWKEANLAHPQTGYVRAGTVGQCTPQTCPAFPDVVADAVKDSPGIVIVTGGANDLGEGAEKVADAVTRLVSGLRTGAPEAKVVVVNPWWDLRPEDPALAEYTKAIKDAATAAGATWADTGQPLVGHPDLMQADGLQPNDKGHQALAEAVFKALQAKGLIAA